MLSPFSINNAVIGSGGKTYPNWVGNMVQPIVLNSASGTGAVDVITGAPGYYVTRLFVEVDATATKAAAGMVNFTVSDTVSGEVAQFRIFLPAAFVAPTIPTGPLIAQTSGGFLWNNKSAGSKLQVSLNLALTAGSIRFSCNYGLTDIVD